MMRGSMCKWVAVAAVACVAGCGSNADPCAGVTGMCVAVTGSSGNFTDELKGALIGAQPGETIAIASGTFDVTSELSLTGVDGVTLKGQGRDQTILDFSQAVTGGGGNGLTVESVDGVTIEQLAIQNTEADGIVVHASSNASIHDVRVEWTDGADPNNGRYGIYPAQVDGVYLDNVLAIGASDAGIYVGECQHIIVRNSEAHDNVAGFQIENSFDSESYDNWAHGNTAGMMWHDLPGKTYQHNGGRHLAHDNLIEDNNHPNFGHAGDIVSELPAGLGALIMAVDDVEWRNNTAKNNDSINLAVVSFWIAGDPTTDPMYDPYPQRTYVHDNQFEGGGTNVDVTTTGGQALQILNTRRNNLDGTPGDPVPAMGYDDIVPPTADPGSPDPTENPAYLCFQNNTLTTGGPAGFLNLDGKDIPDLTAAIPDVSSTTPNTDITPFTCTGPTQSPITLSFAP